MKILFRAKGLKNFQLSIMENFKYLINWNRNDEIV